MKMNDLNEASPLQDAPTLPRPSSPNAQRVVNFVSDNTLVALFDAYRLSEGIACQDELLRRIASTRRRSTRRGSDLPDPHGSVSFAWRGIQWWPLFQFDADMCVRSEVARIARELATIFADWELALWFVTPNDWLGNQSPIARISGHDGATLQAARADRFIAVG